MHTENGFILVKYLCKCVCIYTYSLGHSYGIDSDYLDHFYAIANDSLGHSYAIGNDSLYHWQHGLFFEQAIL